MSFDDASALAAQRGIDLVHECDERATECNCEPNEEAPKGHAPGDVRCPNRARHSACFHDLRLIKSEVQ
jgi:hypothetical protein